jgi:LPS sulfotransferase NodH
VRVIRRDKVGQAVSLWKAIQTASWRAEDARGRRPEYDRDAIDHLTRRLFEHERSWTRFFEDARLEPLEITYETFVTDYEATIRRVLAWVGVEDADGVPIGAPPLRRQADSTSQEWSERFAREARQPGQAPSASSLRR